MSNVPSLSYPNRGPDRYPILFYLSQHFLLYIKIFSLLKKLQCLKWSEPHFGYYWNFDLSKRPAAGTVGSKNSG